MTALNDDVRRSLLRHMLIARGLDEQALRLQKQGALDLWPSCQGHEAAQVGSALAVGPDPMVFPSYREHAVALQRGVTPKELFAQWAGRTFCGWDPYRLRFTPYTMVLATQTLHGVGYSIGRRLQGREDFVVVYLGDGATSEGDMSEAMNLAAVESACVLFVCQNNGWAISTPAETQMRTSIAERARGFGIESAQLSGQDPETVFAACVQAADRIRRKRAPYLVEIRVGRINGHTTSDAQDAYRSRDDIARARTADPVTTYAARLSDRGVVDGAWLGSLEAEVRELQERLSEEYA